MATDSNRARSADHNEFRLVPTELSATYRFTWLDDTYGVPVVPYARAGLGYYIWWISVADHYAHACANPTRSEEHTSETPVTSGYLVCRLLLEKKKKTR